MPLSGKAKMTKNGVACQVSWVPKVVGSPKLLKNKETVCKLKMPAWKKFRETGQLGRLRMELLVIPDEIANEYRPRGFAADDGA